MPGREGPLSRISRLRRRPSPADQPKPRPTTEVSEAQLHALEQRMAHLERLVEGLQDSVHRESERHAKLIADLQAEVRPEAMRSALAEDARDRGL